MTEQLGQDTRDSLKQRIIDAAQRGEPLVIRGGDSKADILGRSIEGPILDVGEHAGITSYTPEELVVTVRAGTTIATLLETLEAQGQTLTCEPPSLERRATVGGTLACNLSGPARPWGGAIRDAVLGVEMINGSGQLLNFGGTVMKNVAGYDVSRLQAGAMGTLGVITRVNLKVMPIPECVQTLAFECDASTALQTMRMRAQQAGPLSGACWHNGQLQMRLSGSDAAVTHTAKHWGGELIREADALWRDLRELRLPCFTSALPLWRLSVDPSAPVDAALGVDIIDWGGAQRWVSTDVLAETVFARVKSDYGHACLFSGGDRLTEVRSPLDAANVAIQRRLKLAFDPKQILNPGRLYRWM